MGYRAIYEETIRKTLEMAKSCYGERLVFFVVFGSVGRGVYRPDSYVDILIVAESLPKGRLRRVQEFYEKIERPLERYLRDLHTRGVHIELSPVFKTKEEVLRGSPLFLDMVTDGVILYDKGRFFQRYLETLRRRLEGLGAKRIQRGNAWYWILKPDYRYPEVIEL